MQRLGLVVPGGKDIKVIAADVTGHKDAEVKTFDQVRDDIIQMLTQKEEGELAKEYIESLKDIAKADNSKLIFMPLEASSVIGALGGIGELAKSAFNKKG